MCSLPVSRGQSAIQTVGRRRSVCDSDSGEKAGKIAVGAAFPEDPILYELVEAFVRRVGPGVMKKLILERSLLTPLQNLPPP
jgi:hypothetical protein